MSTDLNQERQKWDAYYSALPLVEPDEATNLFNQALVESVAGFLPDGAAIMEAGCGGGWQALALQQTGRYATTILDFSPEALRYATRVFESRGETPRVRQEDLNRPGNPEFDLVFNAGVLEHYTPEQQSALIRSMASRSRRYVLVLIPNARCYWYWLWRAHMAAHDRWQWGKEIPLTGMRPLFERAGLKFLGERYFGESWTEYFISSLQGMSAELAAELLTIHRSPAIPADQKSYLLAALASVDPADSAPAGWETDLQAEPRRVDDLAAALADSTAALNALRLEHAAHLRQWEAGIFLPERHPPTDHEHRQLRATIDALAAEVEGHRAAVKADVTFAARLDRLSNDVFAAGTRYSAELQSRLDLYRAQRAWTVMLAIRKAYTQITRYGLAGLWQALKAPLELLGPADAFREYELPFPDIWDYLPQVSASPAEDVVSEPLGVRNRPDVVILPVFDFEFRFQRPQQIAARLAERGHRVWWVSPGRMLAAKSDPPYEVVALRERLSEVRIAGDKPELYSGHLAPEHAAQLVASLEKVFQDQGIAECVVILQFPYWRQVALSLRQTHGARVIYDCMDDWQQWKAEPRISPFNLQEEVSIAREADVVLATSGQLQRRLEETSGRSVLRVRNGADFAFFSSASANNLLTRSDRPIVGYYGAIADWVDVELMTDLIAARPQYDFVLIGEVHGVDVSRLRSLPNAQMLGEKNYRLLPSYLWHFDACLLLFKQDHLTSAVDPVKVYEYLSQGKPVVATPLHELERQKELLYFAGDLEEACTQLDRALQERDEVLRQKRMDFARAESWQARAESIVAEVEKTYPLVSVLVVSYNSAQFLRPCLESIQRNTSWPNYEVIVLDNASSDESPALIEAFAQGDPRFRAMLMRENLGFAGGNNAAAREARGEYLVLLNADTIVTAGWLHRLLRPFAADSGEGGPIGLTTPVTNFSGNETRIATNYADVAQMERFAAARAASCAGQLLELRMAALLCAAVPAALWRQTGGLDERFGIGMFEDDDFSMRIKQAGYRVVATEDCFIHHFGNGSFGALPAEQTSRVFEENRRYFEEKWGATWQPHTPRPGVPPPGPADRIPVARFLQTGTVAGPRHKPPKLVAIHPASAKVGVGFQVQPDGSSALVAECGDATPATSIQFGDQLLATTYGHSRLVSALVPRELLLRPGVRRVRLVNDFGMSAPLDFTVED